MGRFLIKLELSTTTNMRSVIYAALIGFAVSHPQCPDGSRPNAVMDQDLPDPQGGRGDLPPVLMVVCHSPVLMEALLSSSLPVRMEGSQSVMMRVQWSAEMGPASHLVPQSLPVLLAQGSQIVRMDQGLNQDGTPVRKHGGP